MTRRIDILDAWRTLAILLMLAYHFLFDLYLFGVLTAEQLFCTPLNIMQKFICCSFILLSGISTSFSRNNLRRGLTVLLAGVLVETGAAVGGQRIRFGILMLLGASMALAHFIGPWLRKLPRLPAIITCGALFLLTDWWTGRVMVAVPWLYPLGFLSPGFYSADYFPLFPWFFLFAIGMLLGGVCRERRNSPPLSVRLPDALTWLGRHSLLIYVLHQPVLYGLCRLIWR